MNNFDLIRAIESNKYVLLRERSTSQLIGLNCEIVKLSKGFERLKKVGFCTTRFIGFRRCSFDEYISKKVAYLPS